MNRLTVILVLALAASLEAGGDALIRVGLRSSDGRSRFLWFSLGAMVLFLYGLIVNAPAWNFGRLIGLYVVFFFVAAQLISWLTLNEIPSRSTILGGLLIVGGGIVIVVTEA